MSDESKWMTVKEAASYLKISQMTLFRWMKSGKVTHYKLGNSVRFTKEDLDKTADVKPAKKSAGTVVEGAQEASSEVGEASSASLNSSKTGEERCQMCGHDQLVDGQLQSTGLCYFKPLRTKFWTFRESTIPMISRMCVKCGYLHSFADPEKLEKLRDD